MSQLAPITLVAPGSQGLNTEKANDLLPPVWATEATNCVLAKNGRIASRKGWETQTANAISGTPAIDVLFEYLTASGTSTMIVVAANKIYKDVDDFTDAANDITPTGAPTADHWQFVNFNGKVLGWQKSHTPIYYAGTGDFATITAASGSVPAGNAVCAAFGRVWAVDTDLQTIKYSALLDETRWDAADGGGSIDMRNVWTRGMDEIVAVKAFNGLFVVFGKNHIVMWTDGQGSALGLDPTQMYVADVIEGTGCIARDSIQAIGEGDMVFLSRHGIQALSRLVANKSNPIDTITKNVRAYLSDIIQYDRGTDTSLDAVRSAYSPEEGIYVIVFPSSEKVIVIDSGRPFPDENGGLGFAVTEWSYATCPTSFCSKNNGHLLLGFTGEVGRYAGNSDNGSTYDVSFWTGYLDMGEFNNQIKFLKEVSSIVSIGSSSTLVWKWEWDFSGTTLTSSRNYTGGSQAEFNSAQYNIDEYGGGVNVEARSVPGRGQGQFIRVGVSATINSFDMILQQIKLVPKIGRLAA